MMSAVTSLLRAAAVAAALLIGAGLAPLQAATDVVQQIQLDEKMIQSFIEAQKEMAKVAEKSQGSTSDKPDPSLQKELESVAAKNGFKSFAEFDDVAANILLIMAGIDPQSGAFTDPVEAIKKEISDVEADKTLKDADKKQMLEELNEALKVTQPVKFPSNIDLVKKFRDKIDAVLQ
jgi:Arc/MetJ-type ribon-helix-helix transcriptional regulator